MRAFLERLTGGSITIKINFKVSVDYYAVRSMINLTEEGL